MRKCRFLKRAGRNSKHHNLAKSRSGTATQYNLFNLDDNRHAAFHLLFGVRTFLEAAAVLIRADRMRRYHYKVKEGYFTTIWIPKEDFRRSGRKK
jgi:hypothetical protein